MKTMFDASEYFPRSIDSDHPSQSVATEPTPPDNAVSYDMVHNLTVDIPKIFWEKMLESNLPYPVRAIIGMLEHSLLYLPS